MLVNFNFFVCGKKQSIENECPFFEQEPSLQGCDPLVSPPASLEASLLPFSRLPDSDGVEDPVLPTDEASGGAAVPVVDEPDAVLLTLPLLPPAENLRKTVEKCWEPFAFTNSYGREVNEISRHFTFVETNSKNFCSIMASFKFHKFWFHGERLKSTLQLPIPTSLPEEFHSTVHLYCSVGYRRPYPIM
jgi:hypothetical protein